MKVKVLYFAQLKAALGGLASEAIELPANADLGMLLSHVYTRHPASRAFDGSLLYSVNQKWADNGTMLQDGDEIALMPPLSGG